MTTVFQTSYQPAFPALSVVLRVEDTRTQALPALLDTDADISFIPTDLLEQAGAPESEPARIRSHFGDIHTVQLYLIGIEVEGRFLPGIYVVGDDAGSEIILGRDVLNKLPLFLDGPNLESEVLDDASANRLRARRQGH